jgi:RNA polymerase sigma factor (TIGR02999 family)
MVELTPGLGTRAQVDPKRVAVLTERPDESGRSSNRPRHKQMSEITALLDRVNQGDSEARDALYARLYPELRKLARSRLARNETITLLDTTGLVHETYLRFLNTRALAFADRGRFFAYAASVMHSVIVDEVRKRRAERRGGDAVRLPLDDEVADGLADAEAAQILRVHEALGELAALDPRLAQVVEMRYFGGCSEQDIADSLGITERTVRRDWSKARTLLYDALNE